MTNAKKAADEILDQLAAVGKASFGDAIKEYWFYREALCPACRKRPSGALKYKGHNAISLNCFMYRERGVLIGYFLCGPCARKVLRRSSEGEIHKRIERNLIAGYLLERHGEETGTERPC
ncbi:MAG TPA: hypothetical protein PLP42_16410 [Acidobacteriota bacterium]|nr:hypothetical protein [Acidobacteriota bacterium]